MASVRKCNCGQNIFQWSIKNFSMQKKEELLQSPKFKVELLGETEWVFNLYPNEADGYIAYGLDLLSEGSITATSEIAVVASDDFSYFDVTKKDQKFTNGICVKEPFVKRNELSANEKLYLPGDTLTIECGLSVNSSPVAEATGCVYILTGPGLQRLDRYVRKDKLAGTGFKHCFIPPMHKFISLDPDCYLD